MRPTSGATKACDRAAWAHSIMVAAAKGWKQSAASLSLDLAKFDEHVGHWEESRNTSFPTRLLACWCASDEGRRFLEADKCHISFLGFWDHSSRLQWGHNGCQIHARNSHASPLTGSGT